MLALGTSFLGFGSYTHDHDKTMGDDHHKETGSEACEPQCFFTMSLDPSLILLNDALGGEDAVRAWAGDSYGKAAQTWAGVTLTISGGGSQVMPEVPTSQSSSLHVSSVPLSPISLMTRWRYSGSPSGSTWTPDTRADAVNRRMWAARISIEGVQTCIEGGAKLVSDHRRRSRFVA